MKKRAACFIVLALLASASAHAGPVPTGYLTTALNGLENDLVDFGKSCGLILGPVITAYGGGKASLAAARHQDWVKPLLFAIFGAAVIAVLTA